MVYRISELPAGAPPYNGTTLLELSVPNPAAPTGYDSRKALLSDVFTGVAATLGVIYPSRFGITGDHVNNSPDDMAALLAHMLSIGNSGQTTVYPKLGHLPLIFPAGSYKFANFTVIPIWGTGATISGVGYLTVLDNVGIEIPTYRTVIVERMLVGKRDTIIVPGSYGLWVHGNPRGSLVNDIAFNHKDIAVLGGATFQQSALVPGGVLFNNVTGQFSRIGLYVGGIFACEFNNCLFGGGGTMCDIAALLYGAQGMKTLGGFWQGANDVCLKITGNRRRPSVENYFIGTTFTGLNINTDYPVLGVTDDGGFARLTLSTKIGARIEPHPPIMIWDPFFKEMRGPNGPLVEGVANNLCRTLGTTGQVTQITIGGTALLPAPIAAQATELATNNLIAAAINAGTATHGYSAYVRGALFYLDALGNQSAVGLVVTTTTSGGITVTPDEVCAVVFDSPHGFSYRSDLHFEVYRVNANVTFAGTTMTVNSITSGGNNIKVGQLVYAGGIGLNEMVAIASQTAGTPGGIGTYTVNHSPINPAIIAADVLIGSDEYDGQFHVEHVKDANTVLTRLLYEYPAIGQAWKQLFIGTGLLHVNLIGTPTHASVRITAVDDTSALLATPFSSVGIPTALSLRKFDIDIEVLDTNASYVNDQFFNWGNVNWMRIRSAYNLFFVGPRPAKVLLWIDKRSDRRLRSNRIFFIRPGHGRQYDTDYDEEEDNNIQVHGTNEGFAIVEMTQGSGVSPGSEGVHLAVGAAGKPLINLASQIIELKLTGTEIQNLIGSKAVAFMDESNFTTPWFHGSGVEGSVNRVTFQSATTTGTPRIDAESYGVPPDETVHLLLDTKGTGALRFSSGGVEKSRVETLGPRTLTGVATTFPLNRAGRATLVAGTVAVPIAGALSSTEAYVTRRTPGGTLGHLSYAINAGTQVLTITSSSTTDTSIVSLVLIGTDA